MSKLVTTKGPFEVDLSNWPSVIEGGEGEIICLINEDIPESEANAHMIAKSLNFFEPMLSLLDRCEKFIAGFEDDPAQEGIPELLHEIRSISASGRADLCICHASDNTYMEDNKIYYVTRKHRNRNRDDSRTMKGGESK